MPTLDPQAVLITLGFVLILIGFKYRKPKPKKPMATRREDGTI